jgi:imidazolonepropionase-like amidohydrolase
MGLLAVNLSCSRMQQGTKRADFNKSDPNTISQIWFDPEEDVQALATPAARPMSLATQNPQAPLIAIAHATVMTATGTQHSPGTVVMRGGAIVYVGTDVGGADAMRGATVIDGTGMFVTPGIIDAHSHIGVYASPTTRANEDGNEATAPVTAQARAKYGYASNDPQITRAMAGGVTAALILPGSANLIGGRGFTVAMKPARTPDEAAFVGAPETVKMACGENPKRVYGEKGGPSTRMGLYAAFRAAFSDGQEYQRKLKVYARERALWLSKKDKAQSGPTSDKVKVSKDGVKPEPGPTPPARDLKLETLAGVLSGDILVQIHCYKATDISQMMAIADEYRFKIRSFHHALEAYKVRDLLISKGIAINTWADWWGFKLEAFDGIPENAALFTDDGGRATIHSDSAIGIQRLNQEAGKALASGRAAGIKLTDDQALRWLTANPAWVLGIDSVTGTLEVGKRADVVMWSASPFSVYSQARKVFVAGELSYDAAAGRPQTDFELGNSAADRPIGNRSTGAKP